MLRQVVADYTPSGFGPDPKVHFRRRYFVVVQHAERDRDDLGVIYGFEPER